MRIVIDLQAVQCEGNRTRGIGRYALNFTKALLRAAGEDEIRVALNAEMTKTVEYVRAELDDCISQDRIVVWKALPDTAAVRSENRWRHRAAAQVREAFLASLKPDVVHVTSLLEGYYDDLVTTVNPDSPFANTGTLYDLIPLIYSNAYLADPGMRAWYMDKMEGFKRADMLLGISQDACSDAGRLLGIPPDRVANVSAAADNIFQRVEILPQDLAAVRLAFGIRGRFLMYTGGIDYRKNLEGLIRAYAGLDPTMRASCQLVIVCAAQADSIARLREVGRRAGLVAGELVFTGYASDADLLTLYHACEALVFPSWHEGFGLPPLEAMACGAAVIGSNTSSIPEVIGRADALFDPRDDAAITAKMREVLVNEAFRDSLRAHGPIQAQKFSWDESGRRSHAALHVAHEQWLTRRREAASNTVVGGKPLLAYVSPVPPENSGVADLSAELLPALAEHYRIEVVADQPAMSDPWMRDHLKLRSTAWFLEHAKRYDRVAYQLGNGGLHAHMLAMLEQVPGTVLLHEIFLSGITRHLGLSGQRPGYWEHSIYESHGYAGLLALRECPDSETMTQRYPCSLAVIRDADGIVVHSRFNAENADKWYGSGTAADWSIIPLLRELPPPRDRAEARKRLGIPEDCMLVCCFGIVAPLKLNHRVLEGWLASKIAVEHKSVLAFVGACHDPAYAETMRQAVAASGCESDIRLTGWIERETYLDYASAADMAVQLRGLSRGEASYSVLDCLVHGIPTVINAHGPMTELPADATLLIPDEFKTSDLADALDRLAGDAKLRRALSANAKAHCREVRDPRKVALLYRDAIERHARSGRRGALQRLGERIMAIEPSPAPTEMDLQQLANGIAANQPRATATRQMLVDISELVRRDARSGIQRVVRSLLACLLKEPPAGFRVEPVYAEPGGRYRYARTFTAHFLGFTQQLPPDDPIDVNAGDIFLGLDLVPELPCHVAQLSDMRARGVELHFVLHDLLPISRPECFPNGSCEGYAQWVRTVLAVADGIMCVSQATAEELHRYADDVQVERLRPLRIGWFHHGSDIAASVPSNGITQSEQAACDALRGTRSFLMVGTIEPRKGHAQALAAFELLWANGSEVRLVIVGKAGWQIDSFIAHLRGHPELGKRLFWFEGASDELLMRLYAGCTALLLASEGEGFGLPLIEAAQHRLPILCRDLPVFREVAGSHAAYFNGYEPQDLAAAIENWLGDFDAGRAPVSDRMILQDWRSATHQLLDGVLHGKHAMQWMSGRRLCLPAYDRRLELQHCRHVRDWLESDADGGPAIVRSWSVRLPAGAYRVNLQAQWLDSRGFVHVRLLDSGTGAVIAQGHQICPDWQPSGPHPICDLEVTHEYAAAVLEIRFGPATRWRLSGCSVVATSTMDVIGRERHHAFQAAPSPASDGPGNSGGGHHQLLVDVSELARRDARGGIQRVVRSILGALLASPPTGFTVCPVRTEPGEPYRYARDFLTRFTGQQNTQPENPIKVHPGDVFIGLDLSAHEWVSAPQQYQAMRDQGAQVYVVLYDLLPILRPGCFIHAPYELYEAMVAAFARTADGVICISQSVAEDLRRYLDSLKPERDTPLRIGWFHLGADLASSRPSEGISDEEAAALDTLKERVSFLAVGTVEPRKGYAQTLDAFERLWAKDASVALVIVGAPGWFNDELLERLRMHAENGRRLFWFTHASDELLTRLYDRCSALLAPSEGEGFGLPLIEAAKHDLPILCRDIPVFREVAGEHALYFSGFSAQSLADTLEDWITLGARAAAPDPRGIAWLSWDESTRQLLQVALRGRWSGSWLRSQGLWFPVHDRRMAVLGAREKGFAVARDATGTLLQTWPASIRAGNYKLCVSGEWWSKSGSARIELMGSEGMVVQSFRFDPADGFAHGTLFETTLALPDMAELRLRVIVEDVGALAVDGCGLSVQTGIAMHATMLV